MTMVDPAWVEKAREVVALADENAAKAMQHGVDYATEFRAELRQSIAQALADTDAAARGPGEALRATLDDHCMRSGHNLSPYNKQVIAEALKAYDRARTATTDAGEETK